MAGIEIPTESLHDAYERGRRERETGSIESGVAEEMARIADLFVQGLGDKEDLITYAKEIVRLRQSGNSTRMTDLPPAALIRTEV